MKIEGQIDNIINKHLPAITMGEETLESILARYPNIAAELRPELEAAIWLQQARFAMATRPGFIHDSRHYLESKIESMQPHNAWAQIFRRYSPQRWAFNILSPVLLVLLLALVLNSTILTARLSIPGEPLYGSKLIIENIQLALTIDPVKKTDMYIDLSRERTTEFIELVLEGEYEYLPASAARLETEIIASLRSLHEIPFDEQASEQVMVESLKDTLTNEISMLNVLKQASPVSAYPGIELAMHAAQYGLMALR